MHECFADEIAIDFPSVGSVVERMRDAFLGERVDADVLRAEVSLSQREAFDGLVVSLGVPVRVTCPHCGGRGETWTEWCHLCRGTGESLLEHPVRVSVPPQSGHSLLAGMILVLCKGTLAPAGRLDKPVIDSYR